MDHSFSGSLSSDQAKRLLQKHHEYSAQIEVWDRQREEESAALEQAVLEKIVAACNEQIAIAPEVAHLLKLASSSPLPTHPGYQHLSSIRASQGRWAEAICLCREAQAQGWSGPWAERIAQLKPPQPWKETGEERSFS